VSDDEIVFVFVFVILIFICIAIFVLVVPNKKKTDRQNYDSSAHLFSALTASSSSGVKSF